MIIDYFAYACIYGEDVATDADKSEKIYLYNWEKLVKDIPERTLKSHLLIQQQLERDKPQVAADYMEISEQRAQQEGWSNLAEMEYFSNIDKYEDLSFNPTNTSTVRPQSISGKRHHKIKRKEHKSQGSSVMQRGEG